MGKLVKSHLARLLVLVAAACELNPHLVLAVFNICTDQFAAAVHGFFWRKLFWDFLTKKLDGLVDPPILQVINLVCGLIVLAWEWPIGVVAGMRLHQSIKLRLFTLLFPLLAAILLYQATNSALYYIIGIGVYYLAYKDGEVRIILPSEPISLTRIEMVAPKPWSLPRQKERLGEVCP